MIWIIGRTQVNSKADGEKVVIPLQKKYKLTPLSAWGKSYLPPAPKPDSTLAKEGPNEIVAAMPIDTFFNYVNRLMIGNPPSETDKPVLEKFAAIGVKPGGNFDLSSYNQATQEALKKIPGEIFGAARDHFSSSGVLVNGWNPMRATQGTYGTDYRIRAMVAIGGLGANLREDAMYPNTSVDGDGNQLNGANKYVIHFEKDKTPPANAFWSLTLYDPAGYMVANPINRNAIGDRSNLKKNSDGSTDIYIQKDSPGKDKETNWLPAPAGDFNILLRVYWPKEEMINGSWTPTPIKKVN
jgi:DNA sulfur modification protein DndE